ncbi:MAG: anhydro-N-acetylmuramic acid kinase, partial [Hyphomicrobiaceae bacterium]|nr:anhydro-N-acetylmuramic acid kinase [Hyphomicrobiaceae bacterium]
MSKMLRAIGLMSGTSLDGIDVALIETDGEDAVVRGPSATFGYDDAFRARLAAAIEDARGLTDRTARPGCLGVVERELTERHAVAVGQFLKERRIIPARVAVVGFPGHTVLHNGSMIATTAIGRPKAVLDAPAVWPVEVQKTLTVQLGDGRRLAKLLGVDVVWDLRAADAAAGGQAAALVPVYHRALAARLPERPVAVVNIGGVANVTWIGRDGTLIALDTGPGNALIDDWMLRHTGSAVDAGGATAAGGKLDEDALNALLMHPYFGRLPPKSLDRNAFSADPVRHLSLADGAATLTAFTAASLARVRAHFPEEPELWVICGSGRRNRTLMAMLAAHVDSAVVPAEAVGFGGDAVEA